ncbi:XRE family transcriptional regulator [Kitasatospora aureofaciens]|uniref:XRE family transcriptional regulator n=1 Tax=Kitasatospora aureofaciens TaxID=1894 RepID=UPI0036F49357
MSRLNRKGNGRPLREAMASAEMSIPQLAAATKAVDPDGRGVSRSIIGALVSRGSFTRDRCRLRTAWLIATALDQPLQSLFDMPGASTSTKERSIAG